MGAAAFCYSSPTLQLTCFAVTVILTQLLGQKRSSGCVDSCDSYLIFTVALVQYSYWKYHIAALDLTFLVVVSLQRPYFFPC